MLTVFGMSHHGSRPRRSLGGLVVEHSLASVGFRPDPGVHLVETERPRWDRPAALLAQNAWNFVPDAEFRKLARPYPNAMRRRMLQRRALARVNTRRARRLLVMSDYMANLVEAAAGRPVEVSRVVHPFAPVEMPSAEQLDLPSDAFVVVPGTITWYKDPVSALAHVACGDLPRLVVLAGPDDGSGCQAEVKRVAANLGLTLRVGPVSPLAMHALLRRATAVVLPSRLESLGFSLSEALSLAPGEVWASPLPSHRSLARAIGREPLWLGEEPTEREPSSVLPVLADAERVRAQWTSLGLALGLPRDESA